MADTVKDMEFRILYRKKGMKKSESSCWTAVDPDALMRVLSRAEDISPATCDLLVIHGYQPDGTTIEVMCHEPKEVEGSDREHVVVPMDSRQEQILSTTYSLLQHARENSDQIMRESQRESCPTATTGATDRALVTYRPIPKRPRPPASSSSPNDVSQPETKSRGVAVIGGFNIVAYPARNFKEAQTYVSAD
jgi:hypothetical protein